MASDTRMSVSLLERLIVPRLIALVPPGVLLALLRLARCRVLAVFPQAPRADGGCARAGQESSGRSLRIRGRWSGRVLECRVSASAERTPECRCGQERN